MPPGTPSAGDVLNGKYRLDAVLGAGGMAVVYRATHLRTQQACALKVISPQWAARRDIVERFLREAQLGAQLGRHPHIVDILDADEDTARGVPFLVMELLEGETLEGRLGRGPIPRGEARVLLDQLGDALSFAHGKGVVHRDLKPANLFLARDHRGRPVLKVLDFGIAKVLQAVETHAATQIGTAFYAAPEQMGPELRQIAQVQGVTIAAEVSPATDVWALGLIAFEMLTGTLPGQLWGATSAQGLALRVAAALSVHRLPVASAQAGEQAALLPEGFDGWLERCMALESSRRFPSSAEAMEALLLLLEKAPAAGSPTAAPTAGSLAAAPTAGSLSVAAPAGAGAVARSEVSRAAGAGEGSSPVVRGAIPVGTEIGVQTFVPAASRPAEGIPVAAPRTVGTQVPEVATFVPAVTSARAEVEPPARPTGKGAKRAEETSPLHKSRRNGVLRVVAACLVLAVGAGGMAWSAWGPEGWRGLAAGSASASAGPLPADMVELKGGTFQMGLAGQNEIQLQAHEVTVSAFGMDVTEVTVAAYEECVKAGVCTRPDNGDFCTWEQPGEGNHPINCVSWEDATRYCSWAKKRLPTEEEWEFAARGPEARTYPWGDTEPGDQLCWNGQGNPLGKGNRKGTCPVGNYPEGDTPTGLKDLAGGVGEWTSNWRCPYTESGYDLDRCEMKRVYRGSGWGTDYVGEVRASSRDALAPTTRGYNVGFRCARDL